MAARPPVHVLGIDHVVIRCRELEHMLKFYQQVLGLPLIRSLTDIGLYQLRAGNCLIDLVPVGSPLGGDGAPQPAAANMAHLCLRVSQPDWIAIEAWLADHAVATAGAPARRYGADGFGPSIYIHDPEGNQIELKGDPALD